MSRIEKAIEKATRLRTQGETRPVTRQVTPPERAPEAAPMTDRKPMQVKDPSVVCALPGYHPVAEEYRKLKSQILQMTRGETFLNTLLITSALSQEGKSITALNLAVSLAMDYNHSVLLIDADLRRPTLHHYLNFEPSCGLLQCLRDAQPLEQALVKTGLGKLTVLPAGGVADDPVEMLASAKMRSLVAEMKHRYPDRYILFDTPPSLLFAEAHSLGSVVDGVLFLVREGMARLDQIQNAIDALQGANLLGMIYNDAFLAERGKGYGYYY